MAGFDRLPEAKRNEAQRIASFGKMEQEHFDECVKKGLMTKEERDLEFSILHDTIKGAVFNILFSNS